MKNLAVIMLCLLSSVASAKDIEELVVTAKRLRIVIEHISANHKQNCYRKLALRCSCSSRAGTEATDGSSRGYEVKN